MHFLTTYSNIKNNIEKLNAKSENAETYCSRKFFILLPCQQAILAGMSFFVAALVFWLNGFKVKG